MGVIFLLNIKQIQQNVLSTALHDASQKHKKHVNVS